uniref:Origin recognition complex subunit 1 n=1 Tax=Angiostrongylus cantonensis TaxID=6313 RepID=A0A158PC44_ANGCA
MANRVLRPRQTSTAAVVSQTPLKHAMSETVVGRRSLPRSAKVQAEHEGYKSQLFSPDERHVVRKKSNEMTPAAKISQKIASVITVRFRSVLQRNDGSLEYRTVGSESPWGMKRPVARIIPARLKLSKLDLETEQDSPFSVNECEKSSLSEDYSSDDSDEIDDSLLYSDEKLDIISNQRRKSSSRKSILFKTTTPFVSSKPRNGLQKTKKDKGKVGMLENLRLRLHTADVPERMPCREEVVKQLSRNKSCNKFTFVAVNAMELIDPKTIFVGIYNQIVDKPIRISPQAARRKLNTMFEAADKHRPPIVILVDELDQLCTKKQELIYDIFNWTSVELARVSVIAIANTLDLPERMLSQRVTSRIGAARICFQPYEFQQIEHIIHDKLKESVNTVEVEAIQFAARKVAAVTGDLRKAMDVLRHAIEIAIEKGSKRLLVEHVSSLLRWVADLHS